MNSKIDVKKLYANLEIGKVPLKEIIRFTPSELIRLYEIFYQEFFGVEVSFSEDLVPQVPEDYSMLVCIPQREILSERDVYSKMADFFTIDPSFMLDKKKGRRTYMKSESYVICTSVSSKNINSDEYFLRSHSLLITFLESQILWLFFNWLSPDANLPYENDSVLVTSSKDFSGEAFVALDCLERKIFSHKFYDFANSNKASLFRTREVIYKYRH